MYGGNGHPWFIAIDADWKVGASSPLLDNRGRRIAKGGPEGRGPKKPRGTPRG